jgi:hypothetical protein
MATARAILSVLVLNWFSKKPEWKRAFSAIADEVLSRTFPLPSRFCRSVHRRCPTGFA